MQNKRTLILFYGVIYLIYFRYLIKRNIFGKKKESQEKKKHWVKLTVEQIRMLQILRLLGRVRLLQLYIISLIHSNR